MASGLTLLLFMALAACKKSPELGRVYETWETSNDQFKVRVTAFEEHSQFLGGGYFLFESSPSGTDRWREVMGFRHDDPIEIPHDHIHFVNDRVGYIFLGWKSAVTNDAGQTWSIWNAETNLPGWRCCNYGLIRSVELSANGHGKMTLHPIQGRNEPEVLVTENYGNDWRK